MSPLDDELRRTLTRRADLLAPSPDPLAGVARRVARIRRRRSALAVSGAVAVVAAVALAVPGLLPGSAPAPDRVATTPSSTPARQGALDPADPWPFRGTPLSPQDLDAFTREWQTGHPGGTFTPLWAQVWEPSQQVELVFLGSDEDRHFVGWASSSERGPELQQVAAYSYDQAFLQFAVPGDEGVTRLYVVAAPGSELAYSADGTQFVSMTETAPSVGITALEGDTSRAKVRVSADGWSYVVAARNTPMGTPAPPANVLAWASRGDAPGTSFHDLGVAFSRAMGRTDGAAVGYRPLFTGDTDSGVRFTMGQAWFEGDPAAYTVSYATSEMGRELLLGPVTPASPPVLAFLLDDLPGTSVDLLVVVPNPRSGQVSYDTDATGSFRPVTGQDHLDGVVLIDRAKDATTDRLEVLDGNGDEDKPLYRGAVAPLLCGLKECG